MTAITANLEHKQPHNHRYILPDAASFSLINKPAELTRSFLQPWVTAVSTHTTAFFIINKYMELIATSVDVNAYLSFRNYDIPARFYIYIRVSCIL